MMRSASSIVLTDFERFALERLVRGHGTGQSLARRARIVLLAAEGLQSKVISERLGATHSTVGLWRRRYALARLDGLYDEPRPGTPRRIGDDEIAETIRLTLEAQPKNATHSGRTGRIAGIGGEPSGGFPVRPRAAFWSQGEELPLSGFWSNSVAGQR